MIASFFYSILNFSAMPKIKPSALISDIKGKSNGSVFSKNSGGLYFRNNPSGGGKKSAKWDLQKSRFSSLAQAWKSLTEEQQEAWNSIAPEYQTTGAFGDIRNPSGYEVFMRLNGTLSAINRDILTVPLSPRTIPSTGVLTLYYPDLFQLNPVRWASNFNRTDSSLSQIIWDDFFDNVNIMGNYSLSFRWKPQVNGVFPFMFSGDVSILSAIENGGEKGYELYLKFTGNGTSVLYFKCITAASVGTFTLELTRSQVIDGFHFGFVGDSSEMSDFKFFINGILTTFDQAITVGSTAGVFTANLSFFSDVKDAQFRGFVSDFRYYSRRLEDNEMKLVANGYVLDEEVRIVAFTNFVDQVYPNESLIDVGNGFYTDPELPENNALTNMTSNLVPMFQLSTENEGIEGTVINVFASAGVSTGRNGSYSNLRLIGVYDWNGVDEFELWEQFKEQYKNIAPNTQVRFEISVVDTDTGFQDKIRQAVAPRRPRFKAGSELTDKVN